MKNIVIWGIANFNWLWMPLAKELKRRNNAKIYFICSGQQSVENWKKLDKEGIVDSYVTTNYFFFEYDNCTDLPDEVYARARHYEEKYNTLVVDVLQTDKHLGLGFSAGGPNHPKSELGAKSDYLKSVNLFNKVFKFWEDYLDKVKPELVICASSGIVGKSFSVIARYRGIPIRYPALARYQSYFYWVTDEYFTFSAIEEKFNAISEKKVNELVTEEEPNNSKRLPWAQKYYKIWTKDRPFITLIKWIIGQIKIYSYRRYHRIVNMGNYKFLENIKYLIRKSIGLKNAKHLKTIELKDLDNKSLVFFPLHAEPETSLGMLSPEFNEQLAAIELLAKNLPSGTLLVVKEHLGYSPSRPRDFYSTILSIPNVVMVSPHEYATDVIKMARCVIVITSTVGQEAAVLGVPVISFGIHNNYNFLPHVHVVQSWKELRPLLSKLLKEETQEGQRKRKADGRKFLAALKASSINLEGSDYISVKREPASKWETELFYSSLMKSLVANERWNLEWKKIRQA